ncbi:ABC transporter permease [Candidatus Nitrospira inopinata]|uniref:ABC transport system, permease component n=1 Tax=Candidatus Nitrospira inopinata TaxID=1715989 RepID=A0A0S4KTI7_9BACT|nr:ABC transporter permease [Candidatus Nitrospira inopinata]CUQ65684.1 ABC transport system, permease component [Candidatus Nitrospira inopinata]
MKKNGLVRSEAARVWALRLFVMTRKELLQLRRDVPLLLFVIYSFSLSVYISGAGMTMQLNNASLLVHDGDRSESSRELIRRFREPYFRFDGEVHDPKTGLERLDRGTAMLLLDIPPRFHESIRGREPVSIQLQVDTTNAPQGLSAASYAARIVGEFSSDLTSSRLIGASGGRMDMPVVESAHRVWYNPNQDETWFQSISHILRMITLFAFLLPAAALVREKEHGTVEQLLVAPVTPLQIMLSKVLAMTLVILASTALAMAIVLKPVFGVPVRGSLALFFVLTALYSFTTAGLGLFAATVTRNQAQIGMVSLLVISPMLLLSGIATPFEAMPSWVQSLMALSPLRYFVDVTYGILLKGVGVDVLWDSILAMALLGGTLFGLGMWRFRRQLE